MPHHRDAIKTEYCRNNILVQHIRYISINISVFVLDIKCKFVVVYHNHCGCEEAISSSVIPALTHIINTSLHTGTFPTAFKQARVSPLLKNLL